jgi:hypothetical protein
MKRMPRNLACISMLTITTITGCTTPKPILDLASHGAATVGLAEGSLRDYLAATNAQLTARMELLRQSQEQVELEQLRREFSEFLDASAGLPTASESTKLVRTLAAESQRLRETQQHELETLIADTTLDPTTLPHAPAEKLDAAKKGFAILSQELSASEWVALAANYAKAISSGLDQAHQSDQSGAPDPSSAAGN